MTTLVKRHARRDGVGFAPTLPISLSSLQRLPGATSHAGLSTRALEVVSSFSFSSGGWRRRATSPRSSPDRVPTTSCAAPSSSQDDADADAAPAEETVQYFGAAEDTVIPDTAPSVAPSFGSFSELPLFPLPLVCQPGNSIPLHIFEMRYRLMFNRIRDGDSRFGVIMWDKDRDAIASVGCAAELVQFEQMPDGSGRIMTNSIGRSRFRVVNILDDKPYKRALVEYFSDDDVEASQIAELSALEDKVWEALQDVLRLSNKLYDKRMELGKQVQDLSPAGVPKGKKLADAAAGKVDEVDVQRMQDFSFAIAQVLDMPLEQQQLLLQTRSTIYRFRKQAKILDTARQFLAAQVTIKEAGLKF
jgi:ATP-dependent Lon protease